MAANTTTISALHADGVVKDGDKLFGYSFRDGADAEYEVFDVLLRKHPTSGKPAVVIIKKKVAGAAVTDTTQYLKSAEYLRDMKPKVGVSGVTDDIIESIAAQVMTAAELTAAGTPVDSQLPNLASGIDMAFETYTSNTKAGYLRAKVVAAAAVAPVTVVANTATGIDWTTILTYGGIALAVGVGGWLLYKAFKKKPRRKK